VETPSYSTAGLRRRREDVQDGLFRDCCLVAAPLQVQHLVVALHNGGVDIRRSGEGRRGQLGRHLGGATKQTTNCANGYITITSRLHHAYMCDANGYITITSLLHHD
jgi:hypothetical protein